MLIHTKSHSLKAYDQEREYCESKGFQAGKFIRVRSRWILNSKMYRIKVSIILYLENDKLKENKYDKEFRINLRYVKTLRYYAICMYFNHYIVMQ